MAARKLAVAAVAALGASVTSAPAQAAYETPVLTAVACDGPTAGVRANNMVVELTGDLPPSLRLFRSMNGGHFKVVTTVPAAYRVELRDDAVGAVNPPVAAIDGPGRYTYKLQYLGHYISSPWSNTVTFHQTLTGCSVG